MLPDNPTDNRLETNKPTLQKNQGGSVLAPDNLGRHLPKLGVGNTLSTAGGTQALKRTEWVNVERGRRKALIPRPDIVGAILIKISALTGPASSRGSERHYEDILTLADLLRASDTRTASLTRNERQRIRRAADIISKAHFGENDEDLARLRLLADPSPDS